MNYYLTPSSYPTHAFKLSPYVTFEVFLNSHVEITTLAFYGTPYWALLSKKQYPFSRVTHLEIVNISLCLVQTCIICNSLGTVQFYSQIHHQVPIQYHKFH